MRLSNPLSFFYLYLSQSNGNRSEKKNLSLKMHWFVTKDTNYVNGTQPMLAQKQWENENNTRQKKWLWKNKTKRFETKTFQKDIVPSKIEPQDWDQEKKKTEATTREQKHFDVRMTEKKGREKWWEKWIWFDWYRCGEWCVLCFQITLFPIYLPSTFNEEEQQRLTTVITTTTAKTTE